MIPCTRYLGLTLLWTTFFGHSFYLTNPYYSRTYLVKYNNEILSCRDLSIFSATKGISDSAGPDSNLNVDKGLVSVAKKPSGRKGIFERIVKGEAGAFTRSTKSEMAPPSSTLEHQNVEDNQLPPETKNVFQTDSDDIDISREEFIEIGRLASEYSNNRSPRMKAMAPEKRAKKINDRSEASALSEPSRAELSLKSSPFSRGDCIRAVVQSFGPLGASVKVYPYSSSDRKDIVRESQMPLPRAVGYGLVLSQELNYMTAKNNREPVIGDEMTAYIQRVSGIVE